MTEINKRKKEKEKATPKAKKIILSFFAWNGY
jgi:hypothetical protein